MTNFSLRSRVRRARAREAVRFAGLTDDSHHAPAFAAARWGDPRSQAFRQHPLAICRDLFPEVDPSRAAGSEPRQGGPPRSARSRRTSRSAIQSPERPALPSPPRSTNRPRLGYESSKETDLCGRCPRRERSPRRRPSGCWLVRCASPRFGQRLTESRRRRLAGQPSRRARCAPPSMRQRRPGPRRRAREEGVGRQSWTWCFSGVCTSARNGRGKRGMS